MSCSCTPTSGARCLIRWSVGPSSRPQWTLISANTQMLGSMYGGRRSSTSIPL
ncbi:hypothetical protein AURDEDRAFT_111906 [Auricularia subglabra TFB-10046 SS5]|nr:hypothetical protein AURDEDRAFT_111906 [Auricularia subglabra TFB-10046 SS5]